MGITFDVFEFFHRTVDKLGWDLKGRNICELGDQIFFGLRMTQHLKGNTIRDYFKEDITVRDYFGGLGMNYTSIDLNGKEGALKLDLGEPITDVNLLGKFDIVTNYGVLEHIRKDKQCLDNIHNLTKPRGLMIHSVPTAARSPDQPHGLRVYSLDFFKELAKERGYRIVDYVELDCSKEPYNQEYSIWKLLLISLQKGGEA
jgi:SAM-dependent methyltransferase